MFVFYRKERPEVFANRFSAPTSQTGAWRLRSNIIFQAKKVKEKTVSVSHNGKTVQLSCTVARTSAGISLVFKTIGRSQANSFTIAESGMDDLLTRKPDSLEYQALKAICVAHTTSSTDSPLISGCVRPNFHASKRYPGQKVYLKLGSRKPFRNPFMSGVEQEYFLVGWVFVTDCLTIKYLGSTHKDQDEVLVDVTVSRIPGPSGNTNVSTNRVGSAIPQRIGNPRGT